MIELSKMLEEYRAGERGLPSYDELMTLLNAPAGPLAIFQSAEQNEQLARDAQTILDAAVAALAAAPQVVADERMDGIKQLLENSHLQHILKKTDEARDANDMGRRARAAFEELCEFIYDYRCAAAPVQAQEPMRSKSEHPSLSVPIDPACSAKLDDLGDDRGQGLNSYWKSAFRAGWKYGQDAILAAPVQPVTVPDGCDCDDGLMWEAGCTSPCEKCQDVTDDSAAAPAAQGDAKELNKKLVTVLQKVRGYHVNHHIIAEIDAALASAKAAS